MKEHEITLGEMFSFATENLPDGWEMRLRISVAGVDLSLWSPDEKPSGGQWPDDADAGELVLFHVNEARKTEGLSPVWHPMGGLPTTPELVAAAERELEGNPVEMPEALKDPMAVLRQIEGGGAGR